MRYRVTADVVARARVSGPPQISKHPYVINLTADSNQSIVSLSIERRVEHYDDLLPRFETVSAGSHSLTIPDSPLYDEFRGLFQYIESVGSFWFGIHRIDWLSARHEWVAETEDERAKLSVYGYSFSADYGHAPIVTPSEGLKGLLELRESLEYLTVPMAFFREGMADFGNRRYVNAFFQFYFYLEGLYGGGKTRNYAVQKAFVSSKQVCRAVELSLPLLADPKHGALLTRMCQAEGCGLDVGGVIAFLVKMRGNLHHFSIHGTRSKGHPLNQLEFESLAYLSMGVCIHTVSQLITGAAIE